MNADIKSSGTSRQSIHALPRVHVLGTGGTIAGTATGLAQGSYTSGALSAEHLCAAVPQLARIARLSCEQISGGGSQDMSESIWLRLARAAVTALDEPDIDGIVVTHGTDTLEETAFFLSLLLPANKPVVVTGSTRAATAPGADGPANLTDAVALAACPQARGHGVVVVFDGTIFDPRSVVRAHIRSTRDFEAANGGPRGHVGANGIYFLSPPPWRSPAFHIPEDPLPRVAIVVAHVGISPDSIEAAIRAGARGIIWAGTGNGNGSAPMMAALADAVRRGVVVVRASRIGGAGQIERNIEIDDDEAGFLVAYDLDAFKARILLQLLLAREATGDAELQAAFAPFSIEKDARP
jgi:L-asparaginase